MKLQYAEFAEKHLDIVNITGTEAMIRCPIHGGTGASMQMNLATGLWVCFSAACGAKGNIKTLYRELGMPGEYREPEPELDDLFAMLKELGQPTKKDGKSKVQPETLLSRYDFPTKYWEGRGFTEKTIRLFGLGCDVMNDAVTIPIRNENFELLGVVRRFLDEDTDLRYKYPKGFKRSLNLFGSWLVEGADVGTVALVEGSLDAIKCWQAGIPAVALYGSSISPTQVRLLRRLGVEEVVLFLDNDKAGRKGRDVCLGNKTHRRKKQTVMEYDPRIDLRRWFIVREVKYVKGMPSDPGACSEKQIKKALRHARMLNVPE